MDGQSGEKKAPASNAPHAPSPREQDAIYQGERIVAKVLDAEVDMEAKEVRIGKVYESDQLMIPEECAYQQYRLLIQRVAHATKNDKDGPQKGRILRGVIADILGYLEQ